MPHRVLCIEGNEATRARVKSALEARGFAVDTSETGLDGISRALARPPDLVLADVHLPDIEGYELAARLKRDGALSRVPFVAVGDSREEHELAVAAGADGFVERSLDDDRMGEEVRAYLAGTGDVLELLRHLVGIVRERLDLLARHRRPERAPAIGCRFARVAVVRVR